MNTFLKAIFLAGLTVTATLPVQAEERYGMVTSVQGSALHIDNTLYRTTLNTRRGYTLGDLSEATWKQRLELNVGDEVVFETTAPGKQELDYLLKLVE